MTNFDPSELFETEDFKLTINNERINELFEKISNRTGIFDCKNF